MSYKFIEHPADIAVEVDGYSLEELFKSACYAWRESAMNISSFNKQSSKKFIFNGTTPEILLIELLSELNFQLYSKDWIFVTIQNLNIARTDKDYHLEIELFGQTFHPEIHNMKEEIKAITYHQVKIEKTGNLYKTLIVFDI